MLAEASTPVPAQGRRLPLALAHPMPTLCPPRWVFVQRCVPETRGVPLERLSDLMKREGDAKPGAKTE